MNIYEPEEPSQKSLNDSQKGFFDTCINCKKLKKELKSYENIFNEFCNLIDPSGEKNTDECIEDLKTLINQKKILLRQKANLLEKIKKTAKFIEQQNGRNKINLDIDNIKYLRDIKKMTFEEIAKKYNVSRNTIRNRYYNK